MATIAVIGAGMAGMACAARLSVKGHDVHIFDKSDRVGGKVTQIKLGESTFDLGPTYLTLPAVYRDLFLKTGGALEDEIQLVETESFFRFNFTDGSVLTLPNVGVGKCIAAIKRDLGNDAAEQWREYMKRCSDMWTDSRSSLFETQPKGIWQLLSSHRSITWFLRASMHQNLATFIRTHITDQRLIELAEFYAASNGSSPRATTASLAVMPYLEEALGAHYISGGTSQLAQALRRRCTQLGVTFHFHNEIIKIEKSACLFQLTTANEETFTAEQLVVDAPMSHILNTVVSPDLHTSQTRKDIRFLTKHASMSEFVLLLSVRGKTPNIAEHNTWFNGLYQNERNQMFGASKKPECDLINAHITSDDQMSPADGESWRISVPAPLHNPVNGVDWSNELIVSELVSHILNTIKRAGIQLDARIEHQHVVTPADFERMTNSAGGALFGVNLPSPFGLMRGPKHESSIEGFYFIGSSTHPGAGLAFEAMSANSVAAHIGSVP